MRLAVKFSITLALVYSMVFLTACPSANAITRSAQTADRLPTLGDSVILAVDQGYKLGVFGPVGSTEAVARKDAFVKDFRPVIDAGRAFDAGVKLAKAVNDTSAATMNALYAKLNVVITGILKVGQDLKLLPADKAATIIQTVTAVANAVLQISAVFMQAGYHSHEMEALSERYA